LCLQPQWSSMQCACLISYCHLWPVRLYCIFPRHLINGTIFWKTLLNLHTICVLIFCTNLSKLFLILSRNERDDQNCMLVFMQSTRYSCRVLTNLPFLDVFSKNTQKSNITKICQWEPEPSCPCGQTDGQTDMTKLIVAFCNFANAPENGLVKNWVFNSVKCSWGNSLVFRDYTEISAQKS